MRFLETISESGNDILIRIDSIMYVLNTVSDRGSYVIKIKCHNGQTFLEYFEKDHEKLILRYRQIKKIIEAE